MKTFKEYFLDNKHLAEQTVYLPHGAEIVNIQDTYKGLMLLAITKAPVDVMSSPELRTFKICVNDEIIYTDTVKYIGSFKDSTSIKHVIEIIKEY